MHEPHRSVPRTSDPADRTNPAVPERGYVVRGSATSDPSVPFGTAASVPTGYRPGSVAFPDETPPHDRSAPWWPWAAVVVVGLVVFVAVLAG